MIVAFLMERVCHLLCSHIRHYPGMWIFPAVTVRLLVAIPVESCSEDPGCDPRDNHTKYVASMGAPSGTVPKQLDKSGAGAMISPKWL